MYDQNQENPELEALRNANALSFSSENLQSLASQMLKSSIMDKATEEMVLELSNDFLEKIIDFAFKFAKHRGSDSLEPNDIKFAFENLSHVKLTARIIDGLREPKKVEKNINHLQRLNAMQNIKKE